MLPHHHFQYQIKTEPVFIGGETVSEDKWHQPWSEPRRYPRWPLMAASGWFGALGAGTAEAVSEDKWHILWSEPIIKVKAGLRTSAQQFTAFNPVPVIDLSMPWFTELSKPVSLAKPRLREGLQQTFAFEALPRVSFAWFGNLSEPKRFKPRLPEPEQQYLSWVFAPTIISVAWFKVLEEPLRFPPRFRDSLRQFYVGPDRLIPTPATSGVLNATETKDTFLGGAMKFNRTTSGEVAVIDTSEMRTEIGVIPSNASGTIVSGSISIRIV